MMKMERLKHIAPSQISPVNFIDSIRRWTTWKREFNWPAVPNHTPCLQVCINCMEGRSAIMQTFLETNQEFGVKIPPHQEGKCRLTWHSMFCKKAWRFPEGPGIGGNW